MGTPVIRSFLANKEDAALVLVKSEVEAGVLQLIDVPGQIQWLAIQDARQKPFFRFIKVMRKIRGFKPDTVVLTQGIEAWKGGILSLLSGAGRRAGPANHAGFLLTHTRNKKVDDHKVEYNCSLAEAGGRYARADVSLKVPVELIEYCRNKYLGKVDAGWIGIALGSGALESHKRLPEKNACDLVKRMIDEGFGSKIVLFGGEAEKELNKAIEKVPGFGGINLCGKTGLLETIALLSCCRVLVSTCNGVSHMAAAVKCPVVGLYGPTNPEFTGPYGGTLKALTRGLECAPCYSRNFITGCGTPVCMNMDVNEIVQELKEIYSKRVE